MSTPPVTLLVPCYNAARFLPRLVGYVRAMTVPFKRVLCFDDGSTDDTVAAARSLGLDIITPNPNGGVSRARNRLAAAASTEWIHFHDADDRIHPDFLARLSPLANVSADVVSCDADWVTEDSGQLVVAWRYDAAALSADPAAHLLSHPLGLNNTLLRRSAWDRVGGCDESLAMWEDADIHFRLALSGARWRHLSEVLTWSLRNDSTFSHNYRLNWGFRLKALEGYAARSDADRLRPLIAAEAERAASSLLLHGDRSAAKRAINLCQRLGRAVPHTHHPILRALRSILPAEWLLVLQNRRRRRS